MLLPAMPKNGGYRRHLIALQRRPKQLLATERGPQQEQQQQQWFQKTTAPSQIRRTGPAVQGG